MIACSRRARRRPEPHAALKAYAHVPPPGV